MRRKPLGFQLPPGTWICAFVLAVTTLCMGAASIAAAAAAYDVGMPVVMQLWVNPASGADANSGTTRDTPLKSLTEAWNRIPANGVLSTTGYQVNLLPGSYPCEPGPEDSNCQNYFSDRTGTFQFPVIIRAADGPGTVTVRGGLNLKGVSYLYLQDLQLVGGASLPTNSSGNNLLHIEEGTTCCCAA